MRKQVGPDTFQDGTPLHYCINLFGGMSAFCRAIGRSSTQIYRWRDRGGLLSPEAQTDALIAAKRLGININPARLVYFPSATTHETSKKV